MVPRPDSLTKMLALVAVSIALAAYVLARPGGPADVAATAREAKSDDVVQPAIAPDLATNSGMSDEPLEQLAQDESSELDVPIDGVNDDALSGPVPEDIVGNTTINDNGEMVRPGPPAMRDHSISSEDDVSGAE